MTRTALLFFCVLQSLCVLAQDPFTRTYGDLGGYNTSSSITRTFDYGYLMLGSGGASGNGDFQVIKTDSSGNVIWRKFYGTPDTDAGFSVKEMQGGKYILAGITNNNTDADWDILLICIDSEGNELWRNHIVNPGYDECGEVLVSTDSSIYLCATTPRESAPERTMRLYKLDSQGTIQWRRDFDKYFETTGTSLLQFSNGDILSAGSARDSAAKSEMLAVRWTSTGDTVWSRTYGTPNEEWIASVCLVPPLDLCILGGNILFPEGNAEPYMLCIDPTGYVLIDDFSPSDRDFRLRSIRHSVEGNCLLVQMDFNYGELGSNSHVVVMTNDLYYVCDARIGTWDGVNVGGENIEGWNKTVVATGTTGSHGPGITSMYLQKIVGECNFREDVIISNRSRGNETFEVFPVPSNGKFRVNGLTGEEVSSIEIFNISGQKVDFYLNTSSTELLEIELTGKSPGIYFLVIRFKSGRYHSSRIIVTEE